MKPRVRTVCVAYFNHLGQRLKLPHSTLGTNANTAVMRCHWHMMVNTYGAYSAQVYDIETGELFAEFVQTFIKGVRKITTTHAYEPRRFGDPIRRSSAHAFFHDLEIMEAEQEN